MQHSHISFRRPREIMRRRASSRSTLYRDLAAGLLPPLIRLGPGRVGLPENELDRIDRALIAGASDDEVRALVREIVAQRQQVAS